MKYIISWFERPQGSPIEYENAQKRILEVFGQWKAPANFKIEFFVIRVGEWGGHMLVDCDDPLTIHKFCSMLPAFVFQAPRGPRRGRSPGRTRSNRLARQPERRVTFLPTSQLILAGSGGDFQLPDTPSSGQNRHDEESELYGAG
jgi:hypothetical protein